MSVKRDPRTGRWFFRTMCLFADGKRRRVYGTPGIPGPYHDLAQSQDGARKAEHRAIAAALKGVPVAPPAEQEVTAPKTIREHSVLFLERYKPDTKPGEKREKRKALDGSLLPVFGDRTIESLDQAAIDAYTSAELARGLAVKTVNNRLAVLSSLIRYVTGRKPDLRLKLSGMAGEIHAVPSAHVELMLAHATPRERAIVLLGAEAGFRAGEMRGLQWPDVERDRLVIRRALDNEQNNIVIAPKHNKGRTVPLSPRLAAALAALPRRGLWVIAHEDGGLVTYDQLNELVNELYARAEVPRPPKPIHCLRHTFGTVMARRVPLPTLQRLMGHSDIATTMRYVDVAEDDKREAITLVFGALDGRGSGVAADRESEAK